MEVNSLENHHFKVTDNLEQTIASTPPYSLTGIEGYPSYSLTGIEGYTSYSLTGIEGYPSYSLTGIIVEGDKKQPYR